MKFSLQSVGNCHGRAGWISNIDRLPGLVLETPSLLLYTKGGSVPHLTREVLEMVTQEGHGVQLPLSSTLHTHHAVSAFKKGIAEFVGLKEHFIYCTVQDPATLTPGGYNTKDNISVWSKRGKACVDANKYMDIMEAFQPDLYHVLCDGDTTVNSPNKRIQKSVDRTSSFFTTCLERHKSSKTLKSSGLLAVVEGGYDLKARQASARDACVSEVVGCIIDGLHNNGPQVEHLAYDVVRPVIEETLKHLPEEKLRIVHGCWKPETILQLVELGIDMFDASYPYLVTERRGAIVFGLPGNELSLTDSIHCEAFEPICGTCSCLTCKQHTRAYIHHLFNVKELLAPVLLMIHNLHQYLEFFKNIRKAIKEKSLHDLRKTLFIPENQ